MVDDYLNIDHGKLLDKIDNPNSQSLDKNIIGNLFGATNQIFGTDPITPGQ